MATKSALIRVCAQCNHVFSAVGSAPGAVAVCPRCGHDHAPVIDTAVDLAAARGKVRLLRAIGAPAHDDVAA